MYEASSSIVFWMLTPLARRVISRIRREWAASAGIFSGDIALQLLNGLFLPGDDPLHEIADGQHTLHALTLHDWQVANTTGGHYGHALVDRLLWSDKNNWAAHDLPDQSLFRRPPLEHDFTGIVTL